MDEARRYKQSPAPIRDGLSIAERCRASVEVVESRIDGTNFAFDDAMNAWSPFSYQTPRSAPRIVYADAGSKRSYPHLPASLGFATLLLISTPALAVAVAPTLGAAFNYTVLGTNAIPTVGTVTCTNTGPGSTINGNVGSTFTSITNTSCTITGAVNAPVPGQVVTDFDNAFSALDTLNPVCDGPVPTVSTTLAPGVYCSDAGTTLGAGVIFTLNGSASDVWVFKIGTGGTGALTGTGFSMVMGGSALACNVYWRSAEAATMTDSSFIGTILAGSAITMTRGSYLGRALATTDVTVTDAAPMTFAGCGPASVASVPTLSQWMVVLLGLMLLATGRMPSRRT